MDLLHRPGLLASVSVLLALTFACGGGERAPQTASERPGSAVVPAPDTEPPIPRAPAARGSFPPPVPNGEPMPPSSEAAGIPPYPNAIVWMRNRSPGSTYRLEAFTPDRWEQVALFYEEQLPEWNVVKARDMVIFQKEPDQAAITVSQWDYQAVPADAPDVLRRAQTAIGAAWR